MNKVYAIFYKWTESDEWKQNGSTWYISPKKAIAANNSSVYPATFTDKHSVKLVERTVTTSDTIIDINQYINNKNK